MEGEHARVTLQTKQELSPHLLRGDLKHSSAKHLTSPQLPNRATPQAPGCVSNPSRLSEKRLSMQGSSSTRPGCIAPK